MPFLLAIAVTSSSSQAHESVSAESVSICPGASSWPAIYDQIDSRSTITTIMTEDVSPHDWLPGPLTAGSMPLSVEEIQHLYASNLVLTEEDVSELSQALPYLGDILSPEHFGDFVRKRMIVLPSTLSSSDADEGTQATSKRTLAAVADLCGSSSAKVVANLRNAVYALSLEAYEAAYARLVDLSDKRKAYRRRNALIATLAQAAPNWAAEIVARRGAHARGEVPGDVIAAWRWRQAQQG